MKIEKIPHKQQVVNEMRQIYYSEKYKAELKGKCTFFETNRNFIVLQDTAVKHLSSVHLYKFSTLLKKGTLQYISVVFTH